MKRILQISFLVLIQACAMAQIKINVQKKEGHVEVPGTQVAIVPPPNFTLSSQFTGFQDVSSGSSIMVLQVSGTLEDLTKGMENNNLKKKRLEVIKKETAIINGKKGYLIKIKQFSPSHGYNFLKYTLLMELENNKSLMVNGSYPEIEQEELDEIVKDALLSVYYDKNAKLNNSLSIDFTVDLTKSKFKPKPSVSGAITMDIGNNGKMVIAKSIRSISAADKKGASIQVLKAISGITYNKLENWKDVRIDGAEGYQVVADILHDHKPAKAMQTILFGEHYYYHFIAIVPSITPELDRDYNYIVNSFRRK